MRFLGNFCTLTRLLCSVKFGKRFELLGEIASILFNKTFRECYDVVDVLKCNSLKLNYC